MIRLAVRVSRDEAEVALAALLDFAPNGVEETEVCADVVEYAIYGAPGELPELPDLRAAAGDALVDVSTTRVADDWGERWKAFHEPVLVGAREGGPSAGPAVYVRAPWEPPWTGAGEVCDIVIDPGQAFGTGAHATTRLCLELLAGLAASGRAGGAACDVGCGSGVLAIAASKLGWGPVTAVDHDVLAVDATRANALVNGVDLDVERCDLRRDPVPVAPSATTRLLLLANLLAPLIRELGAALVSSPARPDTVIASGLLAHEIAAVASEFANTLGMRVSRVLEAGEWGAALMEVTGV